MRNFLTTTAAALALAVSGTAIAQSADNTIDLSLYEETLSPYAVDAGSPEVTPQYGEGSIDLSLYEETSDPFSVGAPDAFGPAYARWIDLQSQRASTAPLPTRRPTESLGTGPWSLYGTD
jgi:hypothetical protein